MSRGADPGTGGAVAGLTGSVGPTIQEFVGRMVCSGTAARAVVDDSESNRDSALGACGIGFLVGVAGGLASETAVWVAFLVFRAEVGNTSRELEVVAACPSDDAVGDLRRLSRVPDRLLFLR